MYQIHFSHNNSEKQRATRHLCIQYNVHVDDFLKWIFLPESKHDLFTKANNNLIFKTYSYEIKWTIVNYLKRNSFDIPFFLYKLQSTQMKLQQKGTEIKCLHDPICNLGMTPFKIPESIK